MKFSKISTSLKLIGMSFLACTGLAHAQVIATFEGTVQDTVTINGRTFEQGLPISGALNYNPAMVDFPPDIDINVAVCSTECPPQGWVGQCSNIQCVAGWQFKEGSIQMYADIDHSASGSVHIAADTVGIPFPEAGTNRVPFILVEDYPRDSQRFDKIGFVNILGAGCGGLAPYCQIQLWLHMDSATLSSDAIPQTLSFTPLEGSHVSISFYTDANFREQLSPRPIVLDLTAANFKGNDKNHPHDGKCVVEEPISDLTCAAKYIIFTPPLYGTWVDPEIVKGYDFSVDSASPQMMMLELPVLGDNQYTLRFFNGSPDQSVVGGVPITFLTPVDRFQVLDIDKNSGIDPNDPRTFIVWLNFIATHPVVLKMTPIVADGGPTPFNFTGFFPPVDNLPTLNSTKAGSAVPVKFSLGGDQGLNIFTQGYPKSTQIPCDSTALVDGIEETVTAGSSSLSYDATTDEYVYVWKTDKTWSGTCRQLVIQLNDDSVHRANFRFK